MKKQYQKLDDTDEFDETINKNSTLKNYSKLDILYDTNHSFTNIKVTIKSSINVLLDQIF